MCVPTGIFLKDSEAPFLVPTEPVSHPVKNQPSPQFYLCFASKETETEEKCPWPWLQSWIGSGRDQNSCPQALVG